MARASVASAERARLYPCKSGLFYRRPVAYIQIQGSGVVNTDFPSYLTAETLSVSESSPRFLPQGEAKEKIVCPSWRRARAVLFWVSENGECVAICGCK